MAVISDVHGNLAALEAVLEAISSQGLSHVVCLGDLVGYCAEPSACIALVKVHCEVVVAGNHDRDVLRDASPGTNNAARQAQSWTRDVLPDSDRHYLAQLPSHTVTAQYVAAHGAYLSDVYVSGYVTSTMLETNLKAIAARPGWPVLALCGHTHVPLLGAWDGVSCIESTMASPCTWPKSARSVLANPGAVGQPRDGDARAAYGVVDFDARRFAVHRVAYDVERTVSAMARAGLPGELGERLREGR